MLKGPWKGHTDLPGDLLVDGRGQNRVREYPHREDVHLLKNSMAFGDITQLNFECVPGR